MPAVRAVRRDMARLTRATRGLAPIDPARVAALRGQWAQFAGHLHDHHRAEDRLVWPVLEQRAGDTAARVLADMSAEHDTIDPLLARVEAPRPTALGCSGTCHHRSACSSAGGAADTRTRSLRPSRHGEGRRGTAPGRAAR